MPNGEGQTSLRRRRREEARPTTELSSPSLSGESMNAARDDPRVPLLSGGQGSSGVASARWGRVSSKAFIAWVKVALIAISFVVSAVVLLGPLVVTTITPYDSNWRALKHFRVSGDVGLLGFLTLNTFMRPVPVGTWDYQVERLPLVVDAVSSYEVAATQEMFWMSGKKKAFLRALKTRDIPFYAAAPMPGLRGALRWPPKLVDGGLTITSAFPIAESDFITYDATVPQSIDYIVAKGALYAKILLPVNVSESRPTGTLCLHVFTTHAQANNGLDPDDFMGVRYEQMNQLASFIRRKTGRKPECPVIVAGDFNVNGRYSPSDGHSSPEYNRTLMLLEDRVTGLHDVLYEANERQHPVTGAGGLDGRTMKNERLDYIFFAPSPACPTFRLDATIAPSVEQFLSPKGSPFRTVSDHYGVAAKFDYS